MEAVNNMTLEEMKNEEMYVLVAPDGSCQLSTLAPDFPMCIAMVKLLHQKGISKSYHEMVVMGEYKIMPVKVTIMANGTQEEGFQKFKQDMNKK